MPLMQDEAVNGGSKGCTCAIDEWKDFHRQDTLQEGKKKKPEDG